MVSNHLYAQGDCHGTAATGYNTMYVVLCTPFFSSGMASCSGVVDRRDFWHRASARSSALLRVMGLDHRSDFQTYHRVLNRCVWSSLQGSQILLQVLLATFTPRGRLVFGLDDTIERRRGDHIAAKGLYRDPVRSSQGHFVKASGLRWLSLMLLVPVSWADRIWALPFLTVFMSVRALLSGTGSITSTTA